MNNQNKATHKGSCQCCGRLQKLPDGKLAKHGYVVAGYGYFVGVCRGAGYLPFEQSFDQVARYVREAKEVLARFETSIAEWSKPSTEPQAWLRTYVQGGGLLPGRYVWCYVPIIATEHPSDAYTYKQPSGDVVNIPASVYLTFEFVDKAGKKKHLSDFYGTPRSLAELVNHLNAEYVTRELQPEANRIARYIKWQRERIKSWKPAGLTPVVPPKPPDPNRRPRFRRRWA